MASDVLTPDDDPDEPERRVLMAVFRQLQAVGRKRGWVTIDEFNEALPDGHLSAELMEGVLAMLGEAEIDVVEG